MTEEMKQKRDELAANHSMTFGGDNGINGAGEPPQYDQTMYGSFQEGFDAAYKLMEAENAEFKKNLNGQLSMYDKVDRLFKNNKRLLARIEKLREALVFYGNKADFISIDTLDGDPELGTFIPNDFETINGPKWFGTFLGKTARAALKADEVPNE